MLLYADDEEVESTLETQDQQAKNIDGNNKGSVLTIANDEIMKTEQIMLLGVNMDENLNFTQHSEICTKASQKVGVLMRLRNLIPCQAELILYKTAIMPHLTYCHLVWNFCKS